MEPVISTLVFLGLIIVLCAMYVYLAGAR